MILVLGSALLWAAAIPAMTLEEAVTRALERNPAVISALENYRAAEHVQSEIGWLPDPVLMLGYKDGGWMQNETMQVFMVDQPIPFPTKTSGSKSRAEIMGRAECARYENRRRETEKAVKIAYIDILLIDEMMNILEEDLHDAVSVRESARLKYETGTAPYHDMVRTRIDALLTENDLATLREDDRVEAVATLRALLDMEDGEELGELGLPEVPVMEVRVESLLAFDVNRSPELDEFRFMADASDEELNIARQRYIPDLKLRFWAESKKADAGEISTRGVALFFNVPLWFWNTEAAKDVRTHRMNSAISMLESQRNRLETEIEKTVAAFAATRERLDLIENDIVPEAEMAYASGMTAYENGSMDLAGLVSAREVLRDARLSRVRMWAKAARELAEIERLTGLKFY